MPRTLPLLPDSSAINGSAVDSPTHPVSRRTFLGATGATVISCLLVQACGGGDGSPGGGIVEPPPPGSATFANGVVTVDLSLIPALTAMNGHQVLALSSGGRRADLSIINVGGTYRAFTSICTHEGCTVSGYNGTRLICPCHGSEFDRNGQVVNGPALSALREYAVTLNTAAQTLTIAV